MRHRPDHYPRRVYVRELPEEAASVDPDWETDAWQRFDAVANRVADKLAFFRRLAQD